MAFVGIQIQIYQWARIKNLEHLPMPHPHIINFGKGAKANQWKILLTNGVIEYPLSKHKSKSIPHMIYRINLKWIKHLNVNPKAKRLLN